MRRDRRWRAAVTLVAALALAVPAAANAFTVTVVTGQDLSEPGIDVAPDGTLFVNAIPGLPVPTPIFRSTDGGATWAQTPATLRDSLIGGGDADLAVDPTNSNNVAFSDLWLGSDTVSTSSDKGNSWLSSPLGPLVLEDRQWITAVGGGVVYHVVHQIPAGLLVSKSLNGGLIYPLHGIGATIVDTTGEIGPPGNIVAEGSGLLTGNVGFIYPTSTGTVKFAHSSNGGLTFSSSTINPGGTADVASNFPVVANGGGGHLYAVWTEVAGSSSTIHFATSSNWGTTWSGVKTIVASGTSVFPWVAAHGSNVAVSLYHTSAAGTSDTVPADATWFESLLSSSDGGATFSALTTVDPTPAKTGPVCTEGINCSGNRQLGDFQQVAMDSAGTAFMTWVRVINGDDVEIRFAR